MEGDAHKEDVDTRLHQSGNTSCLNPQARGRNLDQSDPSNRSDRDRISRDPERDKDDHDVPHGSVDGGESDTADSKDADRHDATAGKKERSTTDFVEQVEGAQDTAKKYSVDDEVGGKGVGKANEREEVDDYI